MDLKCVLVSCEGEEDRKRIGWTFPSSLPQRKNSAQPCINNQQEALITNNSHVTITRQNSCMYKVAGFSLLISRHNRGHRYRGKRVRHRDIEASAWGTDKITACHTTHRRRLQCMFITFKLPPPHTPQIHSYTSTANTHTPPSTPSYLHTHLLPTHTHTPTHTHLLPTHTHPTCPKLAVGVPRLSSVSVQLL